MFIDVRQSRCQIYVVADLHSRILARVTIHVHVVFNRPLAQFMDCLTKLFLLHHDPPPRPDMLVFASQKLR
jgi:hypothetical protein